MATTTRSPAPAASSAVAARAIGPSSPVSSLSVSGPRELLSTTACPAATASRATVPPIIPLPMNPTVAIIARTEPPPGSFRRGWRGVAGGSGRDLAQGRWRHIPSRRGRDVTGRGRDVGVDQRTRSRGPGGRVLAALAQAPQRLAVAERERGFQPRALLNFRQVHHGINEAGPAPRGHVSRG